MRALRFFYAVAVAGAALGLVACSSSSSTTPPPIVQTRTLYVSDAQSTVKIYTLPLTNASTARGTLTGLPSPYSMHVDPAGRLIVGSFSLSKAVSVFAPPVNNGAAPAFTITVNHTFPAYVTTDSVGNLFVSESDSATCCIEEFNAPLSGTSTVNFTLLGASSGIDHPYGIVLDGGGNLYVSNALNILKFNAPISGSSTPAVTRAGNFDNYGIALDAAGNLYVENATADGTIDVFTPPFTSSSTRAFAINVVGSKYLTDIAFDSAGDMYVTDQTHVYVFTPPFNASSTPSVTLTTPAHGLALGP